MRKSMNHLEILRPSAANLLKGEPKAFLLIDPDSIPSGDPFEQ